VTGSSSTTSATNNSNNEVLADFALQIFERARQLQHERTGLMSNKDAMEKASLEVATKALADIRILIEYTRLFRLDTANEQIRSMLDQAMAATAFSVNVKNFEIEEMHSVQEDDSMMKEPIQTKLVSETECVAP
jgi:hypothetical protein